VTASVRTSGAVSLVLALGSCAVIPGTACSDVGAISGIVFELDDVLATHRGETLLVTGCVGSTCDTLEVPARPSRRELAVGQGLVTDDSPVPISLTVTRRDGDTVFAGQLEVNPVKQQPNGPGCPPVAWAARVTATGDGELRQIDRRATTA
jgi:hypothetical protein